MITEKDYIKRVSLDHRKKFAQFFTPEPIAEFMAKWVLNGRTDRADILEPAFGLGVFSHFMLNLNPSISIDGYDIDNVIFSYVKEQFSAIVDLKNEDYINASWVKKYDGIICNPPYLKFHDYDNATLIPLVNQRLHTHLNGFTNIYTLFLLKSISQLKEGGRLAYIIPSEFLNSDYGVEVKKSLLDSGCLRHLIVLDFTRCAFEDALTTACILLCENTKGNAEIKFSSIDNVDDLEKSLTSYTTYTNNQLDPKVKWKQYYEVTQTSKYHHLVPFSTFAKVSRGIATGSNDFFTFKASKIDDYNIPEECFRPCICHSVDVKSLVFITEDFERLSGSDKTVYLFEGCKNETEPHVQKYLQLGKKSGVDKKFLTASRSPWYALENRKPSPIWVSVFNRNGLRFIRNKAGIYNLTTFHCVYDKGIIDTDVLFAYLVTDLAKEIFLDNSRQYGNGLIKFEPNDLNKGNVVDLRLLNDNEKEFVSQASLRLQYYGAVSQQSIELLDEFFRAKYTGQAMDIEHYMSRLESIAIGDTVKKDVRRKPERVRQLSFFDLFDQYEERPIVENSMLHDDVAEYGSSADSSRNCLVCLVKNDNAAQFEDRTAKIYYTGKKFPSTVKLNRLYYFVPYIKGKGIRDLYLIKTARIGTRREGQLDENKTDYRLVFEIEFVRQLSEDYRLVELPIWRTYRDATLKDVSDNHSRLA